MSFPNIPNVTPTISLSRAEAVNLLLASIAFEELGLAHVINAEAEKIQAAVGTLPGVLIPNVDIPALMAVNQSVNEVLKTVIKKEMILEFKLEEVISLVSTSSTTSSTTTTTTTTTTSTTTTSSTTTTATPDIFLFGNIASVTAMAGSNILTASDDAFYNSQTNPSVSGYNITETPIIGVPTLTIPSIRIIKEVSVTQGATWDDANVPNGPALPTGSKPWFRIIVLNNGSVPLTNVTVTDPSLGLVSITPTLVNGAGLQWIAKPM